MGYLLIWLFFGVFAALLASSKNRNVLGWFFIGFLFGPFGLLFAFFMKNGKEIEEEENLEKAKKSNDVVLSEDIYHYEVRPKKGVETAEEWNKVKKCFFTLLNGNYKMKQNDAEIIFMEVSDIAYIKMSKIKKNNEKGSLELLFKIDSVKCGDIDFGNDIEVVSSEKEKKEEIVPNSSNMDNTEKLIKLSEMFEKGLITEEEFKAQKDSVIAVKEPNTY